MLLQVTISTMWRWRQEQVLALPASHPALM